MSVKVRECKVVHISAGGLRRYRGNKNIEIGWDEEYAMLVYSGRGPVFFADGCFVDDPYYAGFSSAFNKAALRRCFQRGVDLAPGEDMHDDRTQIYMRRLLNNATLEINMPCGQETCLKVATARRLVKELT